MRKEETEKRRNIGVVMRREHHTQKKKKPTKVGLIAISFKGYATYSVLYEGAVQVVQCL